MEERRVELIDLDVHIDLRGKLVVAEKMPFEIKRVFWIHGRHGYPRGNHAHKECHQILIPVTGSIWITINDDEKHLLVYDARGLYVPPKNKIKMEFKLNSILLVLASQEYDPDDYI